MMKKYGKNWICWLIWIGIWQLADLFIHNNVIFAGPVNMAITLAGLLKDGDFWLSPVSYTHLDVYKRQGPLRSGNL